jgi:hypothetical protein
MCVMQANLEDGDTIDVMIEQTGGAPGVRSRRLPGLFGAQDIDVLSSHLGQVR